MKHFVKSVICLASALALNASARADDAALPGNPYAMVVERNVFDLVSPPPPDTTPPPAEPPVKITPNGITDILGQLQVLFKVSGRTPGKENSYILSEGQRQDDIEVTKINAKTGLVTFNNHGLVQEIPLANASANATPAAGIPAMPMPASAPGVNPDGTGFGNSFGGRVGNDGGNPVNTDNNSSIPIPSPAPAANGISSQVPPDMTPEEQVVGIEVNRELTKQQVLNGEMPPLPFTEATPPEAINSGGVGGAPLIAPSSDTNSP